MSAEAATLEGRRAAEALMLDSCTITRDTGDLVTDYNTGQVTEQSATVYSGKCKVQSKNAATASVDAAGHAYTVVSRQVHIPANVVDVKDGDVVTVTASALNAFTVGKQYRVEGFTPDTFETAARLTVKEITS